MYLKYSEIKILKLAVFLTFRWNSLFIIVLRDIYSNLHYTQKFKT